MNMLFDISYGRSGSDCTYPYYIRFNRECTVREFIEEVLKDTREWGAIRIREKYSEDKWFDLPTCNYKHGMLASSPFSDDILNSKVIEASGSGGWSLSDYILTIEKAVKEPEIPKLKPCPFCGGEANFDYSLQNDGNVSYRAHFIVCPKCRTKTGMYYEDGPLGTPDYKQKVVNAWNRRV